MGKDTNFPSSDPDKRVDAATLFASTIMGNSAIDPKYVSEYRWFTADEVSSLELGYDHKKILRDCVIPFLKKL